MEYDYFQIPVKSSNDKESLYSLDESSLKNTLTSIPHKSWLEWKRPSFLTRLSTAYTNKPSLILLDSTENIINKGVILCAKKRKLRNNTKVLRWKEYNAFLSPYQLELHSLDNKKYDIFKRKHVIKWTGSSEPFQLSLISPIDFAWKLESSTIIFYFQTENIAISQAWYCALYKVLPSCSKKPLPLYVDLCVPELSNQIRIPLDSLETNENTELKNVRESALTLIHRYGQKPSHWNSKTVGLCWNINNEISWALIPNQSEPAYLIEPRLIEKASQLELRYYQQNTPSVPIPSFYEPIYDNKKRKQMVTLFDNYLLVQKPATSSWKNCFKPTEPDQGHVLSSAKYIFDTKRHEEKELFPLLKHDSFLNTSKKIKKSGILYVKSSDRCTFEQCTCLLSTDGVLGIFQANHTNEVTVDQQYYIYSGECCKYVTGLPARWACRMFEDGLEESSDPPYQCAFIIRISNQKEYIFLTRNVKEKEKWLLALVKH